MSNGTFDDMTQEARSLEETPIGDLLNFFDSRYESYHREKSGIFSRVTPIHGIEDLLKFFDDATKDYGETVDDFLAGTGRM